MKKMSVRRLSLVQSKGERDLPARYEQLLFFVRADVISDQGIVKIERGEDPPLKKMKREKTNANAKSVKFKNENLPEGATANNMWRRVFIPTYITYIASSEDPWVVDDDDALASMQIIWKAVYAQKLTHIITLNGAVFHIVRADLQL
jgi:hypothetical protein